MEELGASGLPPFTERGADLAAKRGRCLPFHGWSECLRLLSFISPFLWCKGKCFKTVHAAKHSTPRRNVCPLLCFHPHLVVHFILFLFDKNKAESHSLTSCCNCHFSQSFWSLLSLLLSSTSSTNVMKEEQGKHVVISGVLFMFGLYVSVCGDIAGVSVQLPTISIIIVTILAVVSTWFQSQQHYPSHITANHHTLTSSSLRRSSPLVAMVFGSPLPAWVR